jgi:DHA1 family inner membrane transport protein
MTTRDIARPEPTVLSQTHPGAAFGTLIALALTAFCFFTTENLPVGLLPSMAHDLHRSLPATGMLVTAYAVTVAIVSVPLTLVTRRMPRRILFPSVLAVFVVATWASIADADYWFVFGARVVTAVAQSLFWSIGAVTAAGLFPARLRGRVVAAIFGGSSVATIAGVPAGTWLGQLTDWRVPFAALSVLGLFALVAIAVLLPNTHPADNHAATGADPDPRRFWLVVVTTTVVIAGVFTAYTYVSPFLTEVTGFAASSVGPLLALRGVAGVLGLFVAGAMIDRYPRLALVGPVALLVLTLVALYVLGTGKVVAGCLIALFGFAMTLLVTSFQARVMLVAPGSSEIASATNSSAFNVGIAGGAFIGGLLLPAAGVRSTALAGGLFAFVGLAVAAVESRPARARRIAGPGGATR